MTAEGGLTELRRGVLGPCVLALLELRPRFGLELVRDLAAADGLLTSDGTVYPLLNRLRDAGLVTSEWRDGEGERARRYYSITEAGRQSLTAFRADWARFSATVGGVLNHAAVVPAGTSREGTASMSGTALDHRLVRDYLRDLDAALRGLPAAQARELKEQITAHLDDALQPGAGDHEVAATLSRLGSPAGLAAEAGAASGSSGPGSALSGPRVRWRLAAVIAVPAVIAAVLGALQISSDVSNYAASGRDQHLARLDAAVVSSPRSWKTSATCPPPTRPAEGRDGPLTLAARAGHRRGGPHRAGGRGRRRRGLPAWHAVQALNALLAGLTVLGDIRGTVSSSAPGVAGHPGSTPSPSSAPRSRSAPRPATAPATRACRPPSLPWPRCSGWRTRCRYSEPSCTPR